jgi:hypothetical protein
MKIAFIHYHLKTGGVTTVLRQQVAALEKTCDCLVLTGDRAGAELPCEIVEIPGLGYDRPGALPTGPDPIVERVREALKDMWPSGCDVLHIHNPILAKNRQFLQILKGLQQFGIRLFLQVHDFAEDGRPKAYFEADYPADCHYGVINARDAGFLLRAGLERTGVHLLPNAVNGLPGCSNSDRKAKILYPVRAIRRKNLGEAILLTLYLKNGQRIVITQPPNSPADMRSYGDWVRWVEEKRLPMDFEAGTTTPFPELVEQSESMLTTSIAEGFGFSFLEPWTAGKWLWGRRLDSVCADFEKKGIRLDFLYDRLRIPLAWIDGNAFARSWRRAVDAAAAHYGRTLRTDETDQALVRLVNREVIDYGLLNEKFQRQVLGRLLDRPACKRTLIDLNPWLENTGVVSGSTAVIEHNRRSVSRHYGAASYRTRLLDIYDRVVCHPVHQCIDKTTLLNQFFDLDHFPLLKWGPYEK